MNVDDRSGVIIAIEVLAAQGPVGTRGGVEWMRGPCACPRWGTICLLHAVPTGVASRTSTRPPPCPTSAPCPYRTSFGRQNSTEKSIIQANPTNELCQHDFRHTYKTCLSVLP